MIKTFYHITKKENLESIMTNGLVPSLGPNILRCSIDQERNSKDPRICLRDYSAIDNWKSSIYKTYNWDDLVVLEITIDPKDYVIKRRIFFGKAAWKEGEEYAVWQIIPAENIKVIDKYKNYK